MHTHALVAASLLCALSTVPAHALSIKISSGDHYKGHHHYHDKYRSRVRYVGGTSALRHYINGFYGHTYYHKPYRYKRPRVKACDFIHRQKWKRKYRY